MTISDADYGDFAEDMYDPDGPAELDEDFDEFDGWTDVEADANTLASAGWGTDEDYGLIGGDSDLWGEY